ncbi:hypothetical protein G436_4761 [Leptospira interrogans serovar Hardjo str. Norma]|uniref:Uncharacterized protein n=1 Tax=Leptospira interrogans serovar Hardjo str. Norma TaxID=1279460 RepID=A0A0M4MYX4_LEPIR|nr:hypothetical protein G436_4761 [Leptospira interrogans serovar Hardjo str. Norma]
MTTIDRLKSTSIVSFKIKFLHEIAVLRPLSIKIHFTEIPRLIAK